MQLVRAEAGESSHLPSGWELSAMSRSSRGMLVIIAAVVIYFLQPPAGVSTGGMHAVALVCFAVGMWALGVLPEHITGILFMLLAVLLAGGQPCGRLRRVHLLDLVAGVRGAVHCGSRASNWAGPTPGKAPS